LRLFVHQLGRALARFANHLTSQTTFLGQLSKAAHVPQSLKILEIHSDKDPEVVIALDGLLSLIARVEEIYIDLDLVDSLPCPSGVAHQKLLETLYIHCNRDLLVYTAADFLAICNACTSLSQLSCTWPSTSITSLPTNAWLSIEKACARLRYLVALNIATWPESKPPHKRAQLLPRFVYEQLLECLAQRTFDRINRPLDGESEDKEDRSGRLRVIGFGIFDQWSEANDTNQICYLRSTSLDAEGRVKTHATPLAWNLRKFVEPCSDVLDVTCAIRRTVRPQLRDDDDDGQGRSRPWGYGFADLVDG